MARRTDVMDTIVSLAKRRGLVYPVERDLRRTARVLGLRPARRRAQEQREARSGGRPWCRDARTSSASTPRSSSPARCGRRAVTSRTFIDPLTECLSCHKRYRADHLEEAYEAKHGRKPEGGLAEHHLPELRQQGRVHRAAQFNGLLKTYLGPVEDESGLAYLRPETAQGIFINYAHVQQSARKKIPFGIGQIGKSFRNEITPGNFIFRTREFEQMEMEFFVKPGTDEEWHQYWIDERMRWYVDLGINKDNLRLYEHPKEKLSHYSKRTVDIEYRFNFAGSEWGELEGIANRTDFDLTAHSKASGADLSYFEQETGERYIPYVDRAGGRCRPVRARLPARRLHRGRGARTPRAQMEKRTVLRLDHRLAPVKAAVLPLSRNAELSPKARDLADKLRRRWNVEFDDAGAIGRRYRRQDEIGTPYCVTVDFETLEDQAVTVRERDSMQQERISIDQVENYLRDRLDD